MCFIPSEDQIVDVLDKLLTFGQFHYLRSKLNVNSRQFNLNMDVSNYSEAYSLLMTEHN